MTGWKDEPLREAKEFERKDPIKLVKGQNRVKFLDDGQEIEVEDYNDPAKKVKKVVFSVESVLNGKQGPLFVNYGQTKASLFGMLQGISKRLGTLQGHELNIVSTTGGKDTRYTVIEVDREPVK